MQVSAAATHSAQIRRVLLGIFIANLAVVGAKFIVGLSTSSLAVLGDAVHSSVDALNNILALAIIRVAAQGPDEDHPYGHQKFETLGALAIVGFLSVSAFELVKGAVHRLAAGAPALEVTSMQLVVLVATLGANTIVAAYESRRGRQLNSEILLADAAHTRADVLITAGVLTGVMLARANVTWADPVVALIVAGVIVVLAYGIVARSIPILVDQHVLPSQTIQRYAEAVSGVSRAYDIRSRGSRKRAFAELTIAVDREATVEEAHQIADLVESRLRSQLHLHEIIVHVEPC